MVLLMCLIAVHFEYLYFLRMGYLNIQILFKYHVNIEAKRVHIASYFKFKSDP